MNLDFLMFRWIIKRWIIKTFLIRIIQAVESYYRLHLQDIFRIIWNIKNNMTLTYLGNINNKILNLNNKF